MRSFEGDLNEKGLKLWPATIFGLPRFEGDLNEKGLKRSSEQSFKIHDSVLKET